jgi:hypothetical protein
LNGKGKDNIASVTRIAKEEEEEDLEISDENVVGESDSETTETATE